MSDLRRAAEMALEACEHLHRTGDTQVFDLCYADKVIPALRQALEQPDEVLAEREACAKVCEDMEEKAEEYGTECCKWPTPIDCACTIRARGEK